jgi:hypothetical protein
MPSIGKELALLEPPLDLVDQIIAANRASHSLNQSREKAQRGDQDFGIKDRLLLWRERLVVPEDDNL